MDKSSLLVKINSQNNHQESESTRAIPPNLRKEPSNSLKTVPITYS